MITVAISINGNVVYARTAVNVADHFDTKLGNCSKYKLDDGSIIYHKQENGAVKLAKKMLDTIQEPTKEKTGSKEWKKLSFL
jgi:adenylosuccinate synthase